MKHLAFVHKRPHLTLSKGEGTYLQKSRLNVNADEPGRFRLTYLLHGVAKSAEFRQPEVLIGRSPECDLV